MKLIECVPNFSEGREQTIIDKIIEPIKSHDKVHLLDVDAGFDTNRTVVTFIGEPNDVIEIAFKCIKIASNIIDMTTHKGEHPRMGATDVCPLIPVKDISMKECVELSKKLASRVGNELNIPVFLYENSASNNDRVNLALVRKGEYEGMNKKLMDSYWKPDFGPANMNLKAGVTAIGAREFLIAYNINLNTCDKKIATDIAFDIREAGRAKRDSNDKIIRDKNNKIIKKPGKLKFCKAVGWFIDEYDQAQVSINLTNYKRTSIHKTFEEVRRQARKRGLRVTGSEIVGLIPKQALINAGKYYLNKQKSSTGLPEIDILKFSAKSLGLSDISEFKINEKIIEFRMPQTNTSFKDFSLDELINSVSRGTPTPGGGSVSALAGSLGAALSSMVANLSISKKGLLKYYDKYISVSENCQEFKNILIDLIDEDSKSFDNVLKAFRLPKKSKEDIAKRNKEIENTTIYAAEIPLKVLELSTFVMKEILIISEIGNENSISDIGVAAHMVKASSYGASINVIINLKSINIKLASTLSDKVDYYLKEIEDLFIKINNNVNDKLNNDK